MLWEAMEKITELKCIGSYHIMGIHAENISIQTLSKAKAMIEAREKHIGSKFDLDELNKEAEAREREELDPPDIE